MSLQPPRDGGYAWVLRINFTDTAELDTFLAMLRAIWKITGPAVAEEDYKVIGDQIEFMGPVIRIWHDDLARLGEAIGWATSFSGIRELSVKGTR